MQHPISNEAQLKVKLHKAFNSALLTRFAYQLTKFAYHQHFKSIIGFHAIFPVELKLMHDIFELEVLEVCC